MFLPSQQLTVVPFIDIELTSYNGTTDKRWPSGAPIYTSLKVLSLGFSASDSWTGSTGE